MLKKICLTLLTALFVFSTAACGTQDVEAEIKLPILENAGRMNVPVCKQLSKILEQLKDEMDHKDE